MMDMYKYPSIDQYRHFVKSAIAKVQYTHTDDEGHAQYDKNRTLPTISIFGTVKLHGTNAALTCLRGEYPQYQSKNNILTLDADNAGFVSHMDPHREKLKKYCEIVMGVTNSYGIRIYGEWCGGNIQKEVGISKLPKMFVIFDVYTFDGEWNRMDVNTHMDLRLYFEYREIEIFSIYSFRTFSLIVDLGNPLLATDWLTKLTNEVEENCPVAVERKTYLGIEDLPNTIGEGIVWSTIDKHHSFKVKGDKHSSSKVRKLVAVDPEILKSITEFVEYAVTECRLDQGFTELYSNWDTPPDMKDIRLFIAWVMADVIKEESDTLESSGLTSKQVNSQILNKIRKYFTGRISQL